MRDWPGRAHVETLRAWPALAATVERIGERAELFEGAILIGSLSRGEGDALSDVDLIVVVERGRWADAWARRRELSTGALVTFDRLEGPRPRGGHSWLTPDLVKVECLISEPGGTRLAGHFVVLAGDASIADGFHRVAQLRREEVDEYARGLRASDVLDPIEAAYGDLIELLHRELRQ